MKLSIKTAMPSVSIILIIALHLSSCKETYPLPLNPNRFDLPPSAHVPVDQLIEFVEQQFTLNLSLSPSDRWVPRSVKPDGSIWFVSSGDWTTGFFPGCLWLIYELTGKPKWAREAQNKTRMLATRQFATDTHDLGFELFCSFGNGWRLAQPNGYDTVLVNGAHSLASRFNPTVGAIKSWDFASPQDYVVIIDNMMNLELLYWAAEYASKPHLKAIAQRHAENTRHHFYRSNFSTYHGVYFNPSTGGVKQKKNFQGWRDDSAWARGQAWGLYGFVVSYRYTKDPDLLQHAQLIADFILQQLPSDLVPPWDFNAPNQSLKDASAAAVICSALLELYEYAPENPRYKNAAHALLLKLSSPEYLAEAGSNKGFLLKKSTGNYPNGYEIDAPIIYADYYFLEALVRWKRMHP